VLALENTSFNRRFIGLIRRALALKQLGEDERALEDINTILRTDDIAVEQKMSARFERAKLLLESGSSAQAREDLQNIVAAHHNFASVAMDAQQLLDAIADVPECHSKL
jgi:tetratricopeptide (TPR) repeat protein